MPTIRIVFSEYLDESMIPKIGGVETYISTLSELIYSLGIPVVIYQYSRESFDVEYNSTRVVGVSGARSPRDLIRFVVQDESPDLAQDLLIFATDFMIVKSPFKKTLAIQHGVAWDITSKKDVGSISNVLNILKGAIRSIIKFRRYSLCQDLVCVDYNFLNWYRTQVKSISNKVTVIPNFSELGVRKIRETGTVSVLFARRLVRYRGTMIFATAMKHIPAF